MKESDSNLIVCLLFSIMARMPEMGFFMIAFAIIALVYLIRYVISSFKEND